MCKDRIYSRTRRPNQAIYMNNLLSALVSTDTCLNTSTGKATMAWLEITDPQISPWWNTWVIFQVSVGLELYGGAPMVSLSRGD